VVGADDVGVGDTHADRSLLDRMLHGHHTSVNMPALARVCEHLSMHSVKKRSKVLLIGIGRHPACCMQWQRPGCDCMAAMQSTSQGLHGSGHTRECSPGPQTCKVDGWSYSQSP
jgi:hypothetical protein